MREMGFSLVELNISCVVIALLAAISYPHLGKLQGLTALNGESRELYCNLQKAKVEAVKNNCRVVLHFSQDGYMLFTDNGAHGGVRDDWIRQDGEKVITTHKYREGISLSATTFPSSRTMFNAIGSGVPGRVILENAKGKKSEVVLSSGGRIRIARVSE